MTFNVTDLMIQVLPEETWHACSCTVGTNQCGQCTDVTGDDLDKGDEKDPEAQEAAPAHGRNHANLPSVGLMPAVRPMIGGTDFGDQDAIVSRLRNRERAAAL